MRTTNFIPTYLFSLLLWIIASLPGKDVQKVQSAPKSPLLTFILSDPFMHFLVFGLLTLLLCIGFYRESRGTVPFIKVGVLVSGYSLLLEVYQGILPWRTFGLDDLVWNTVGVLLFLALFRWPLRARLRLRPRKRTSQL